MTNLDYIKSLIEDEKLTLIELASLSEYSLDSVKSWIVRQDSERFREVPDRAVSLIKLKLSN